MSPRGQKRSIARGSFFEVLRPSTVLSVLTIGFLVLVRIIMRTFSSKSGDHRGTRCDHDSTFCGFCMFMWKKVVRMRSNTLSSSWCCALQSFSSCGIARFELNTLFRVSGVRFGTFLGCCYRIHTCLRQLCRQFSHSSFARFPHALSPQPRRATNTGLILVVAGSLASSRSHPSEVVFSAVLLPRSHPSTAWSHDGSLLESSRSTTCPASSLTRKLAGLPVGSVWRLDVSGVPRQSNTVQLRAMFCKSSPTCSRLAGLVSLDFL